MARVEPFKAWRPRRDVCADVASPPYDVLSSTEAREMAADNPLSFLRIVKPEIDLDAGVDLYSDEVYAKGAENLQSLKDDGVLFHEASPSFYLYRQRMGEHVQTGLVAGASVDEYEAGLIKKHENTRRVKEDDRTRHVDALNANTGPVFLTYKARPEIDSLVDRLTAADPVYDFTAPDGIQHVVWVVSDSADRDSLVEAFGRVPELYVADGHHRSAAGTRIRAVCTRSRGKKCSMARCARRVRANRRTPFGRRPSIPSASRTFAIGCTFVGRRRTVVSKLGRTVKSRGRRAAR